MDVTENESGIVSVKPFDINIAELMRTPFYEGKFIVYRYKDEVNDEITLLAYSSDAGKLRRYMDSLDDETLFITNIPKQSGVYYLGGM